MSRARWGVVALLMAAVLALAGCSGGGSDVSAVTVTAGPVTVTLPVALSCSSSTGSAGPSSSSTGSAGTSTTAATRSSAPRELTCSGGETDEGAPHLQLAPGTPVDVSVPKAVGDTPWVIAFAYQDKAGAKQADRSPVFAAGQQFSYHLQPPAGAQLTRLEVQSLIAAQAPGGGVEFPAVRTWVLVIDPA
ncbi:MAG TPA: DUF2771 family protein [Nakamurella sp.]|nr:DUF2771 family protein [Nakamurella sp.]